MMSTRATHEKSRKRVYYLSLEFLIGRLLIDSLSNLQMLEPMRAALAELGYGPDEIRRALDGGQEGTVEELLRQALRELAGAR